MLPFRRRRGYTSLFMIGNQLSRALPSVLLRPMVCLLVAAQLLLAFAPLIEWQFGADARPHVEAAGTKVHHAHNADDCAACSARGLLATPNRSDNPIVEAKRRSPQVASKRDDDRAEFLKGSMSRPRAPPIRLA
ncbi:MAG: hypothetical protein ABI469_02940 [Gemmatimonadales bacterium]